ncbi:DMT family transporter [Halomicronema sp. CCY15110]|uniref:DMT family transporter n=1 Tax=Halomicronema sp. CCY15110 TaxID=2767773 RepID=UPI0019528EAD|nr:DMT family transporter [Halomicronema sp. CCY15110]
MPVIGLELMFVLLWSSGFIGAKYGLPYAGPFTLLLIRYCIVAGLLGAWLCIHSDFKFVNRAAIARAAIIGVLAHAVWLSAALGGIALGVSPWIVALITALQPMLTSVLSGPILGERISPVQWWGTCIGLVGVVVVVITKLDGAADVSPWGYVLPFVAAASMTVSTLYQRHLNGNHAIRLPILNSLFVQSVTSAIFLCPLAVMIEGVEVQWTGQFIFALAWLVIMLSIGSYGLMLKLLEHRTAARVASLMYLTPPTTLILGSLLFGDSITWIDALGLVIAAIGVTLVYQSTINLKRRMPRADPRRYLSMKP